MLLHKSCIQDTNAAHQELDSKITEWNLSPNSTTLRALQQAITHFLQLLDALEVYFNHTHEHASSDDNHLQHLHAELKKYFQGTHAEESFTNQVGYFTLSLRESIRHIGKLRADESLQTILHATLEGPHASKKEDLLTLTNDRCVLKLRLHQFGEEIAVLESSSNAIASFVRAHKEALKSDIHYLEDEFDLEEGFERNIRAWT